MPPISRAYRSPPQSGVSRARADARPDSTPSAVTGGFAAVIAKERDLQGATGRLVGHAGGEHAAEIDRVLRHQHHCLGANIALLEQPYEVLPKAERFLSWDGPQAATPRGPEGRHETEMLPGLIARHAGLLADIGLLIEGQPDGQRGELILAEVSRNHEEMAGRLTALLDEQAPARQVGAARGPESKSTAQAEENWDNEGGRVRINPPPLNGSEGDSSLARP